MTAAEWFDWVVSHPNEVGAIGVLVGLGVLCGYSAYIGFRPRRWRPTPVVQQPIDPSVVAESVVDMLSRTVPPRANVEVDGTPIRVTWRIDLTLPRYGFYLVHIGTASYPAADLGVVYAVVESNVAAIARRRKRAGGAP